MLVTTAFDVALVVRSRRRELKLRQIEVAAATSVCRDWIIDFEHGKEGLEFGRVLHVLEMMGFEISLRSKDVPPDWTHALTDASRVRERRLANLRRRPRPPSKGPRPSPTPPSGWRV